MEKIINSNILNLIGNTPLLRIYDNHNIYAKLEYLNPSGSVKDRVAKRIIVSAIESGELKSGMKIVEATSGNMGISLSLVGKKLGFDVTIIMPENMSEERKAMIKNLGAKLILTPAKESIAGSVNFLNENYTNNSDCFLPNQFNNIQNTLAHCEGTGFELYEQMDQKVDVFVSGIGSGGTLSGVSKYLRAKNSNVKIIALEPKNVSALRGDLPGEHAIQGIGDGFIPSILDENIIDDVIMVSDDEAIFKTKELISKYGLLCGISSGANVFACEKILKKYGNNLRIATLLPDRMERYISIL